MPRSSQPDAERGSPPTAARTRASLLHPSHAPQGGQLVQPCPTPAGTPSQRPRRATSSIGAIRKGAHTPMPSLAHAAASATQPRPAASSRQTGSTSHWHRCAAAVATAGPQPPGLVRPCEVATGTAPTRLGPPTGARSRHPSPPWRSQAAATSEPRLPSRHSPTDSPMGMGHGAGQGPTGPGAAVNAGLRGPAGGLEGGPGPRWRTLCLPPPRSWRSAPR